jgi:DNA-binding transcriptional MerR regulator
MIVVLEGSDAEFPIEELAHRAGLTVRNVRSHISRGLLPPGTMRGRSARYTGRHVDRLDLISGLRRRGFSLAAIEVLINQSATQTAEEALRLYRGMLAPWEPEEPVEIGTGALLEWLGVPDDDPAADELRGAAPRLVEEGLAEPAGPDRLRLLRPDLVRAGGQAVRLGMSVESVLVLHHELDRHTGRVAQLFIDLFADQIWASHVRDGLPADGAPGLQNAVEKLQPVATLALLSSFRSVMQTTMDEFIVRISEQLAPADAARAMAIRTSGAGSRVADGQQRTDAPRETGPRDTGEGGAQSTV